MPYPIALHPHPHPHPQATLTPYPNPTLQDSIPQSSVPLLDWLLVTISLGVSVMGFVLSNQESPVGSRSEEPGTIGGFLRTRNHI